MQQLSQEEIKEVQALRLVSLANFIAGVKINYPINEKDKFKITKLNSGFEIDSDNFTFTWVIGFLPLIFGQHWAYSSDEKIILKDSPELNTAKAIQHFFGLTIPEYFGCFVAYFQEHGLMVIPHDTTESEGIAGNLREIARRKLERINYERISAIKKDSF